MTPLLPQFKFNDRSDAGHEVSALRTGWAGPAACVEPCTLLGCLWQMNQQSTPAVSTMLG